MSGRGAFWAITQAEMLRLLSAQGDEEDIWNLTAELGGELEQYVAPMDKAWDAVHRCLTDGTLEDNRGTYPLDRCVLGGKLVCEYGGDYVFLKTPKEVVDIAATLETVTEAWLRERYDILEETDYEFLDEDDWEYALDYFEIMREFYKISAAAERAVLFSC